VQRGGAHVACKGTSGFDGHVVAITCGEKKQRDGKKKGKKIAWYYRYFTIFHH
jgi:hypothetical protein